MSKLAAAPTQIWIKKGWPLKLRLFGLPHFILGPWTYKKDEEP